MEEDHERLEETMRSEHEVSIASYVAETELLTEVTRCLLGPLHLSLTIRLELTL